jgi:hypothetical protein
MPRRGRLMIRCRAGGDGTRPSKGVMVRCRAGEVDDRKVDGGGRGEKLMVAKAERGEVMV